MVVNTIDNNVNEPVNFDLITYKDVKVLANYLSEQGKILPRRVTGLTSKQQKKVTKLIKTARIAALLPFVIGKGQIKNNLQVNKALCYNYLKNILKVKLNL